MSGATDVTRRPLLEIGREQGTDKAGPHAYTEHYERHLGHLRDRPIALLEIGVGGHLDPTLAGASLRMWKEYFPKARIVGFDILDWSSVAEDRITIVQGSQASTESLEALAREHGPFDVIIDDGSHHCRHVIRTFEVLFPHLADDGIYVVEDLQTSYWETYGGSSGPDRAGTSMSMLHDLADGLNHAELDVVGYEPTYADRWVTAVAFYHNLAFIQKGRNDEGSHMLPAHPRTERRFAAQPATVSNQSTPSALRRGWRRIVPRSIRGALTRPSGRPRR